MQTLTAQRRWISSETQRVTLRFFWKELRMLRGLAVGVVGLTVVEMAVLRLFLKAPEWMLISAFGATALFAVAATVTLFAVERETGTDGLLELLPQNRVGLFVGKLLAAAAMTVAVLLVLTPLVCVTDQWPDANDTSLIVSQGLVAIFEAFSYGLLMSLMCPQPLLAAVLAIAAASLNSQLAIALSVENAQGFWLPDFQEASPMRLALVGAIGALDVWLGLNWLTRLAVPSRAGRRRSATLFNESSRWRPRRLGMFGKLMWQSIRESWKTMLAATAVGLLLMFAVDLILHTFVPKEHYWPTSILFMPALYGGLAFRADQRREQYRFLAEHAARPRMVWASRQITWLAPVGLWCAAVSVAAWLGGSMWFRQQLRMLHWGNHVLGSVGDGKWTGAMELTVRQGLIDWLHGTALFWVASLTAFALGQFLSLALRSDVFAGLLSLGGSVVLLAWSYVVFAWQLPALWFVGPLAVGLIWASWLRAPDWLVDRRGLWHWAWPALAVIVPAVIMLCCIPIQRAAQVRRVYPCFNLSQMDPTRYSIEAFAKRASEAQKTGRNVANKYSALVDKFDEPEFVSSGEFDKRFIALSQIQCRLGPQGTRYRAFQYALIRAMELQARDLAASLDLLLAAYRFQAQLYSAQGYGGEFNVQETGIGESLIHWATAPGQTPEMLIAAITALREIDREWPTPSVAVMNEYLSAQAVIRGELPPQFLRINYTGHSLRRWLPYLANGLPGEASRAERALDILAASALDYLAGLQRPISDLDESPAGRASEFRLRGIPWYGDDAMATIVAVDWGMNIGEHAWERASLVGAARTSYLAQEEFINFRYLLQLAFNWQANLAQRRAERVWLALSAYRLAHGAYPDTLEQLSPDYLALWEIRDPYAAGPFGYQPQGFDKWTLGRERGAKLKWYPPHTPLLWSVGALGAAPTERMMKYAESESGERVTLDELQQEDDFAAPFKAEPAMVLDAGMESSFLMPLPKP